MNKLYNTQEKITNEIREFLKNNIPNLRKTLHSSPNPRKCR